MMKPDAAVGIYPTSTVRDVAESLAIDKLSDDTARAIAGDVEYRLNLVIQEAQKFMRHGKRQTLTTKDVDYALEVLNVAPILHPPPPLSKPSFLPVYNAPTTSQPQLYYLADEEIDLFTYLREARKRPPVVNVQKEGKGVGWKAHWLAVEGIQPQIKENPVVGGGGGGGGGGLDAGKPILSTSKSQPQSASQTLSQELQLLFERLTSALVPDPREYVPLELRKKPKKKDVNGLVVNGTPTEKEGQDGDVVMQDIGEGSTTAQESIQEKSTLTLLEQARLASLTTLSSDPSLLPLVPYLIRWMSESIDTTILVSLGGGAKPTVGGGADLGSTVGIGIGKDVVGRERAMGRMGRMSMGWLVEGMEALSSNEGLFIEPYLHQFLPPLLSTILCTSLGPSTLPDSDSTPQQPSQPGDGQGQSQPAFQRTGTDVRRLATDLLARLVRAYGREYESLLPRITSTLIRALSTPPKPNVTTTPSTTRLSPGSPTSGRYEGALMALKAMGESVVVAAVVGSHGVGLKRLGEVLDGLDEVDRDRMGRLVVDYLESSLPAAADDSTDATVDAVALYGSFFSPILQARPDLVARIQGVSV